MAGPGAPKTGGRQAGTPNKVTADVRAMILAALDRAGGEDYLLEQSRENPRAFLSLVGRVIPTQLTGAGGKDLIPERAADPDRIAAMLISMVRALPAPALRAHTRIEHSVSNADDVADE
jgi:hypothetical protein